MTQMKLTCKTTFSSIEGDKVFALFLNQSPYFVNRIYKYPIEITWTLKFEYDIVQVNNHIGY
jgi:hypothetical protein